jgi:hypothetical protein
LVGVITQLQPPLGYSLDFVPLPALPLIAKRRIGIRSRSSHSLPELGYSSRHLSRKSDNCMGVRHTFNYVTDFSLFATNLIQYINFYNKSFPGSHPTKPPPRPGTDTAEAVARTGNAPSRTSRSARIFRNTAADGREPAGRSLTGGRSAGAAMTTIPLEPRSALPPRIVRGCQRLGGGSADAVPARVNRLKELAELRLKHNYIIYFPSVRAAPRRRRPRKERGSPPDIERGPHHPCWKRKPSI